MGTLMNALSIVDSVRRVPSVATSFLVTPGSTIPRAYGTKYENTGYSPCITFCERLVRNVEPPFLRLANVEITKNNTKSFRIAEPVENNASQPFTEVPRSQTRLKVHIDDQECAFTRSYFDNMVTSMVGDLVHDNRMVWQEVLKNEDSRPNSVYVVWDERTKHPKLSVKYLQGSYKFIFPMRLLKTDNVVLVDQPFGVPVLLLSGDLGGSSRGCRASRRQR